MIIQSYSSRISFEKYANFKVKSKFDQKHAKNLKKLIKVFKDNFKNA